MKIKIHEFILTPSECSHERFDLTQEFEGETQDGEAKDSTRLIGYAMKLESCVDYIIRETVIENLGDATVQLKQYIDEYKKVKEEVKQMLS